MRDLPWLRRFGAVLIAILVVAGVAADATAGEPGGPATLRPGKPSEVGMDPAVLAQIPQRIHQFVDAQQISGAVTLVARRGRVVHLEAVGLADVAANRPMTTDAIFAIASMTKPITATALMILQDEGKLSVDDPVAKHLPEFKNVSLAGGKPAGTVTIRHLMTHTAGLGGSQRTEESLQKTVEVIVQRPLLSEPGSRWQYSPGLNVCGRIIEVVSGKRYDEFLQQCIFGPLKMLDTSFNPTPRQRKRLVQLYQPGADKKSIRPASSWLIDDAGKRAPNPSGGLFSTAMDLAKFYQMILAGGELDGRRIVSQAAVAQMTRVQTGDLTTGFTPGNGWGLGWCVVRKPQGVTRMLSPGAYGHGGAFGTQGWVDPKRRMIFVLLIQRTGFGNSDDSRIRGTLQGIAVEAIRK